MSNVADDKGKALIWTSKTSYRKGGGGVQSRSPRSSRRSRLRVTKDKQSYDYRQEMEAFQNLDESMNKWIVN